MNTDKLPDQDRPIRGVPALDHPAAYRIQVAGRLSEGWTNNFGGMVVTVGRSESGEPISELTGAVPDQAGLFGLLGYIRDLGLALIRVEYLSMLGDDDV